MPNPKILDAETFTLNGETVHRVLMEYGGHNVQVLAYGESPSLTVLVDDTAEQVHLILLDEFLARLCGKVTR